MKEQWIAVLNNAEEFFNRSTRCLSEEHSQYRPTDDGFTVAQQVAHVAQTVDWFLEGATSPKGFDMDFEGHMAAVSEITSLAGARAWLARSFNAAREFVEKSAGAELQAPLPEGPVMPGLPKFTIFPGIDEHTAHHRGALTVYSRMLGLTPPLPYMDMPESATNSS